MLSFACVALRADFCVIRGGIRREKPVKANGVLLYTIPCKKAILFLKFYIEIPKKP